MRTIVCDYIFNFIFIYTCESPRAIPLLSITISATISTKTISTAVVVPFSFPFLPTLFPPSLEILFPSLPPSKSSPPSFTLPQRRSWLEFAADFCLQRLLAYKRYLRTLEWGEKGWYKTKWGLRYEKITNSQRFRRQTENFHCQSKNSIQIQSSLCLHCN